jgi:hypothetical protein
LDSRLATQSNREMVDRFTGRVPNS